MNTEDTQFVYDAAEQIAHEFDDWLAEHYDHTEYDVLGVWHEAERADADAYDLQRPEHRVHMAVLLPVGYHVPDEDVEPVIDAYAHEWFRPVVQYVVSNYELAVDNISIRLGHDARGFKVMENPGAIAKKAGVDGLVEITFATPEDIEKAIE